MNGPDGRSDNALPRLLVLASTYPRWQNDHEPGFVHELSRRLTEEFQVTVLCPHASGAMTEEVLDGVNIVRHRYAPVHLERLVNDGGIVTNLRRSPWMMLLVPFFLLSQLFSLLRLIYRGRPDVIHAHWIIPQGLIATLALLTLRHPPRLIVTSHGADLFALRGKLMSGLKRFVLRRASHVSVVSQAMRDETKNLGLAANRVIVAPMGIELTHRFTPDSSVPREAHELLFVGRMVEKKGLRDLIQALPIILEKYPDTTTSIVGFGPEESACRALASNLGVSNKVRFLGALPQSQLPDLYRRATALVAPFLIAQSGDQEGLGLVMVEAIGCHCPVITTRIPAVQEVFDGNWPLFMALPQSPQSLAEQVVKLMDEPASALQWVTALREEIYQRFDYASVANRYVEILKGNVLEQSGQR